MTLPSGTNYTQFYSTPIDSLYRVSTYTHAYEPYVVFPRVGLPYCEEKFVGYGGNKAACLYQMHLSGIEFYVMGGEWVIHRSHAYAEKTRTHEVNLPTWLTVEQPCDVLTRYLSLGYSGSTTRRSTRTSDRNSATGPFPFAPLHRVT